MSANLCWRPKSNTRHTLPDALKFIIRDHLGDGVKTYDSADIPYLSGLRDAKIEGAQELIAIIQKYGEVELWLEY